MKIRILLFVLTLVVFNWCLYGKQVIEENLLTNVVMFTDNDILKKAHAKSLEISHVEHVQRNGIGSELYVTPSINANFNTNVFVVTSDQLICQNVPRSALVYFGENRRIVAWLNNLQNGVHFNTGEYINLDANGIFSVFTNVTSEALFNKTDELNVSAFDVDPSGTYFMFQCVNHRTYIGQVSIPDLTKCILTNTYAKRIFYEKTNIYICGNDNNHNGVVCILFNQTPDGYIAKKEYNFRGMDSVIDIDQSGSRVLLHEESDSFPRLYVQSLATGKRICIGRSNKRALFLNEGVIHAGE